MKKNGKGMTMLILILTLVLILTACSSNQNNNDNNSNQTSSGTTDGSKDKIIIKLGHVIADTEAINIYALKLAESVKERTNGRVEIQIYPNSTLGSNKDIAEQALAGAAVIAHTDPGYMQDFVPDMGIFAGPFLLNSLKDIEKLTKSDLFNDLTGQLEDKGFKVLAFNWYFGKRHVISTKEIKTPADLKGVNMRIPPNVMWRETVAAMGASPTELEWSEVYTGLQSGIITAAEAPLSTLYGSKLYESAKNISLTGHFTSVTGFVMGKKYFDSLPVDIQSILLEEFAKFGAEESKEADASEQVWRKKLEDNGVKFNEVDLESFKEATKVVYTKFDKWTPGLYDKVQEILAK